LLLIEYSVFAYSHYYISMTTVTDKKRKDLLFVVERLLAPHDCVIGVVAVGSVATGTARPDSDIDALVFMSPLNKYIVPVEALWHPSDDTFHSVFTNDDILRDGSIPIDFKLCDFEVWQQNDSIWTDGQRAGLAEGWIAFDRAEMTAGLIKEKTSYLDDFRVKKIDSTVTAIDQVLGDGSPEGVWDHLGATIAFDRLNAAYSYLIDLLFAVNRRWRPWPERQMTYLLHLPWLPSKAENRLLDAISGQGAGRDGYIVRANILRALFKDVLAKLKSEGLYQDDPISEAFIRGFDEPGRAWNMNSWNEKREYKTID
jgi:hypothetical protein